MLSTHKARVHPIIKSAFVTKLNRYRYEYYNLAALSVSDVVYDHFFDEL